MDGLLFENFSILQLVFLILSGLGAWMTGRACASTWRSYLPVVVYILLLSIGVRFILFALFGGTLLSLHYWLVADTRFILLIGSIGLSLQLGQPDGVAILLALFEVRTALVACQVSFSDEVDVAALETPPVFGDVTGVRHKHESG